MQRPLTLFVTLTLLVTMGWGLSSVRSQPAAAAPPTLMRGVVFHDLNGNETRDAGEPALSGIRVSNGRDIVETDAEGRYALPVTYDTIVFVIKPRGWRTPLSRDMLPRFYYIHKPDGSPEVRFGGVAPTGALPESVDFPLYEQEEPDQFHALLFGDTQPRNLQEVDYIAHDVVEDLIGTDASFGVTLGDIAFDDLSTFEPLNRAIALIGIPWYNVMGNHDINYDARIREFANETFERIYGPSYYSFDYGPVHFLVLDDIEWYIDDGTGEGRYRGGFGEEQLEFIRNDLALIPEEQLVVLMMHIPLVDVADRRELYRLIEQRPFSMSISAHEHYHEHVWITREDGWEGPQPHHHVINVTVCGSWWSGFPDERGIPHATMSDGAPNGYSIISFDGHEYSLEYRAAGRSADYQMQIHAPEVVSQSELGSTNVYVNVFNGSDRSVVRMRVGEGEWRQMEQSVEADPQFVAVREAENAVEDAPEAWRGLPEPHATRHLWKLTLPDGLEPGTHRIEVETTEMSGQTFADGRLIRVAE
jgi:3',5'-cyclic AMP phosphodiesterase CpdA